MLRMWKEGVKKEKEKKTEERHEENKCRATCQWNVNRSSLIYTVKWLNSLVEGEKEITYVCTRLSVRVLPSPEIEEVILYR